MQRASLHPKPASRIVPGAACGLIAKCAVQGIDDFRYGDEFIDVLFFQVKSFHFVHKENSHKRHKRENDVYHPFSLLCLLWLLSYLTPANSCRSLQFSRRSWVVATSVGEGL